MSILAVLSKAIGANANSSWIFFGRLWTIGAGLLAIVPISLYLTQDQQGYYYTFFSIVAMQALFELGLTQVLVQISSHEFPFLDRSNTDLLHDRHGRKLAFMAGFAHRWYLLAATIFAIVISIFGLIYFSRLGQLPPVQWAPPWVCLVGLTAVNLYLGARLAFVDGAGRPGLVAALRMRASVVGHVLLFAGLAAGAGLWAIIALPAIGIVMTSMWLKGNKEVPDFFAVRGRAHEDDTVAWREEIAGLQWRVALSWVGGYLSLFLFTPLLFAYQGAVVAGQWGMTFAAFNAIQALGMSWVNASAPRFGALIAQGDRATLDAEFTASAIRSTVFTALAGAGFVVAAALANHLGIALASRFLDVGSIALLAGATTLNTLIYALALYMRAHKVEPLVVSSLVIGMVTLPLAVVGAMTGAAATAAAYLLVTLLLNLPWRARLFQNFKHKSAIA